MIKFGSDDNEKKTHFQTFMTSAGFGPSTTVFKTLAAKEIETVGGFLTMDVKLFSKENLNKDGSQRLSTGDILKLQNLRMWAYCRRVTDGHPDDINWNITKDALANWVLQEVGLIQKIQSGKGILEPIRGTFNLDKAETKNFPKISGKVRVKCEMKKLCDLDGCSRALFGSANGKKYVPSGDMGRTVFENQKKFLFEVFDVRWRKGKARTIITKHSTTKDVYQIWTNLLAYYDDPDRLSQLVVLLSMEVQRHEFLSARVKSMLKTLRRSVRT